MDIHIPGIDNEKGILNSGTEAVFTELLGDVYEIIDDKCDLIENYLKNNEIRDFTTQVHALKTTCRMMGAMELSEDFFTLEKLGKENNLEQIEKLAPDVLNAFRSLKPHLEPFVKKDDSPKSDYDKDEVMSALKLLVTAIEDFDLTTGEEAMKRLTSYDYGSHLKEKMTSLNKLVSNLDYDEAKELIEQILSIL